MLLPSGALIPNPGSGPMKSPRSVPTVTSVLLLLIALVLVGVATGAAGDCEEDLAEAQRELEKVTKERDEFAQRLEDSTTVMIIVAILLVSSYVVFFIITKRQQTIMKELMKRTGVTMDSPERGRPKRRRG